MRFPEFVVISLGIVSLGLLIVGFPVWAVLDCFTRPKKAWESIGARRGVWLAINVVLGFVGSALYVALVRKKLIQAAPEFGSTRSRPARPRRLILVGVLGLLAVIEFGALKYPGYEVIGREVPLYPIGSALKIPAREGAHRATFLNQERYIYIFAADAQDRIYEFYSPFPRSSKSLDQAKTTLLEHGYKLVVDQQPGVLAARLCGRLLIPLAMILVAWVLVALSKNRSLRGVRPLHASPPSS